jgi:polysaccharide export outer membrane protein
MASASIQQSAAPASRPSANREPAAYPTVANDPVHAALLPETDNAANLARLWRERSHQQTDLTIGPGDVIEVSVTGVEELQKQSVRVEEGGTILLPLVGRVKVAGLSEKQIADLLRQQLLAYVRSPEVDLFVTEYKNREVAVTGAVHTPGVYTLNSHSNTVAQLIERAGGVSEDASREILFTPCEDAPPPQGTLHAAKHATNDDDPTSSNCQSGPLPFLIDLNEGAGEQRYLNLPVRPGDRIQIPPGGSVTVVGWVYTPRVLQIMPGLTVLQSIAAAGGPLFAADRTAVKVIRQSHSGAPQSMIINVEKIENAQESDVRVQDGDVVQVPYSVAKLPGYAVYYALQGLVSFGPVSVVSRGF